MSQYEIRKREWPDAFKRRRWPFGKKKGLMRPWGLYRNGVVIGMYETKEEAEAAKPPEAPLPSSPQIVEKGVK